MEYVIERLIEQIATELETTKLILFNSYALIKTTVKEYVRESQMRLIVQPIAREFCKTFSLLAAQEQQTLRILTALGRLETQQSGYSVGNLINFCNHLKVDLTRYDFSCLAIHHADLRNINLYNVDFTHASFSKSVFTQILVLFLL